MIIKFASAQIVYTDIEDVTLECVNSPCNQFYNLDINNDNVVDIVLSASAPNEPLYRYYYLASIQINDQNRTLNKLNFSEPYPLSKNFAIGEFIPDRYQLSWGWGGLFRRVHYFCCVYGPCPKHLCQEYKAGPWAQGGDHFLGVKINLNDQVYYGWVRLSVRVTNKIASIIIKDYAYQSSPNTSIMSGDEGNLLTVDKSRGNKIEEQELESDELRIFPNPISSSTTISFSLSKPEKVSLIVYDVTGRVVKKIAYKEYDEGSHQVSLNAKDFGSGIYFLKMQSGENLQTKKFIVLK